MAVDNPQGDPPEARFAGQAQQLPAQPIAAQQVNAQETLRVLAQVLDTGVIEAGAGGQITCAGPTCRAILDDLAAGFASADETRTPRRTDGRPWAAADLPLVRALTHGETCAGAEILLLAADGATRSIIASAAPVRDREGQIVAATGLLQEITARRQAELALRQSEEHFRLLLGNAPVLVFTTDRDLRYTGVFHSESGATAVASEFLGKRDDELAPYDDVSEMMAVKRAVIISGVPYRGEVRVGLQRPFKYYHVSAEPRRDAEGRVIGLMVASWDITPRKQAEDDAQAARAELSALLARAVRARPAGRRHVTRNAVPQRRRHGRRH